MNKNPPIQDSVEAVLGAVRCSITLPAGTGKTELIAATTAEVAARGGTSLVLTHTHAGVNALRRRIKRFRVDRNRVVIRTIDSWAYDLVTHFPRLSMPMSDKITDHKAAARAVNSRAVTRMLSVSYSNLLVDEYQDCVIDQHELVLALAKVLPTAVLGDPLQCLLNFGSNHPVNWTTQVVPSFPSIDCAYRPYRWDPAHQDLGAWLIAIREGLHSGVPIDLRSTPVNWVQRRDSNTFVKICYDSLKLSGSVAVLGSFRNDCVNAARRLGGQYTVMEAMDEKTVAALAATIDTEDGATAAQAAVQFAVDSTIGLASHIPATKRQQLGAGKSFTTRKDDLKPAYDAILRIRDNPTAQAVSAALNLLSKLPDVTIHCQDAWNELTRSLEAASTDGYTVTEALVRTRQYFRVVGRRSATRVVSRPLLVKGLEYDHVIILDPSRYSAQELYVALTRGSKSVTIVSTTAVIPAPPMAFRS